MLVCQLLRKSGDENYLLFMDGLGYDFNKHISLTRHKSVFSFSLSRKRIAVRSKDKM